MSVGLLVKLSLKVSDSIALTLYGIANCFESQFDDILDVFPLIFALQKIIYEAWSIWVGGTCRHLWCHIVSRSSCWSASAVH